MVINPSEVRNWCDLETCEKASIPQDCILLGSIVVCKPCLLELGEMTLSEEYTKLEKEVDRLFNLKEKLEAMITEHVKGVSSD